MKQEILFKKMKLLLLPLLCLLAGNILYAQQGPPPEIRQKLEQEYNKIKNPEISLDKFIQINSHVYTTGKNAAFGKGNPALAAAAAPQDAYCSKVSAYCTNGDFESGLDQNAYTGAYGFFYNGSLYPDPFVASGFGSITFGFSSGGLNDGNAHQTIVNKADGNDPNVPIPMVAANGGNKALRLGNAVNGYGFEILAKTIKVDASETILSFYYALVLQDPGHPHDQQPAFSVRAYDCATGQELPNVCDLGNGSNIAVSDAQNPFFKSAQFGSIAYRDWSLAQINLSKYVGKTVIIIFTTKDCAQGGHYGYAYLDNLFSSHCPGGVIPTDQGSVSLDITKTTDCGTGNICVKYSLPKSNTTTGDATITLDIYQNGSVVKTLTSPKFTSGSSYCFSITPGSLGLTSSLGGFDYVLTGKFNLSGFALSPIIVGNPPSGQKAGNNNDYMINCAQANTYYSKPSGDLHNVLTWGVNMDGSGANPPDFGAGKTFILANHHPGDYYMSGDWTVGGIIVIPSGSQLLLNGKTLSEAGISGGGTIAGQPTSGLEVTGSAGSNTLNFTAGFGRLLNLTLLNGVTVNLGTTLDIYGTLNIRGGGRLNTANKLTLKSTAATTAIVTAVTGTISGMVTVERYIPPRRAWRMINAPVSGTQTIMAAWQEGATTASPNPNPNPGYGTHITGGPVFGSLSNGFDQHPGSNTSLQYYNSAANSWLAIPNTNSTTVGNTPFMLFIRGDRGLVLDGPTLTPNATTLRAQGNLLTGNQPYSVNASGFTAIPNPYQSPVNFATLSRTNVQNSFYVWDPKMGGTYGVGAYVTVSWNGSSYDVTPAATSPESQYIQPWQSILVRSTGTAGSITFKESDKVSTPVNNVYRITAKGNDQMSSISAGAVTLREAPVGQSLRINLQTIADDNTPALLDEVLTTYSTDYSNSVDGLDAIKMANIGENLAINRQGQSLAIERRHDLSRNDTIQLQLSNTAQRSYLLQFTPFNLSPARYSAYLEDSYRQTLTPIDLEGSSQLSFTISDEAASQSPNRFRVLLLLGKSSFDVLASSGQSTITAYPNPISGSTLRLQLINQPKGTYRVALVNSAGQIVYNSQMEHDGGSAIKLLRLTSKLAKGIYQLQVVHGQQRTNVKIMANNQ